MIFPKTALHFEQLIPCTTSEPLPKSGHAVSKVTFVDTDGITKLGFFKPLNETYPAVLAKYAVAMSVINTLKIGNLAARTVLVFNKGKLAGTLSVSFLNYRPIIAVNEKLPEKDQEFANPSVETLLKYNAARLLVAATCSKCDDRHAKGNFSLDGLLDEDMMLYHITVHMKGSRYSEGLLSPLPKKAMPFKSTNLDNFPIFEKNSARTHWPTNRIPSNLNYSKVAMACEAFRDLAKSAVFKEQTFHAFLEQLLTYDPVVLRSRLEDAFGDLPLEYTCLAEENQLSLTKAYPDLFNPQTDTQSFVDHISGVFQNEYDELYRGVVFYTGCLKNKSGKRYGFSQFLDCRPNASKTIIDWAQKQNEAMVQRWQLEKEHASITHSDTGLYHGERMLARYHQIWRDSHIGNIRYIFRDLKLCVIPLTQDLKNLVMKQSQPISEHQLTSASQLLESPVLTLSLLNNPVDNYLTQEIEQLLSLQRDLYTICKHYYDMSRELLNIENNQNYINALQLIINKYSKLIEPYRENTSCTKEFDKILFKCDELLKVLDWKRHISSEDSSLDLVYPEEHTFDHTSEQLIKSFVKTFFDWADTLEKSVLETYIVGVMEIDYPPLITMLSQKEREDEVLSYIKESKEKHSDILACIFSTGGKKVNSLNTLLVKRLTPFMLKDCVQLLDVDLMPLQQAVERQLFDPMEYTKHVITYARNASRFTHLYSKNTCQRFNHCLYQWANTLSTSIFQGIIKSALKKYEPYTMNLFSNKTRGKPVRNYLNYKEFGVIDLANHPSSIKLTQLQTLIHGIPTYALYNNALYYIDCSLRITLLPCEHIKHIIHLFPKKKNLIEEPIKTDKLGKIQQAAKHFPPKPSQQEILALIFSQGDFESNSLNTYLFDLLLTHLKETLVKDEKKLRDPEFALMWKILFLEPIKQLYFLESLQPSANEWLFEYRKKHIHDMKSPSISIRSPSITIQSPSKKISTLFDSIHYSHSN